MPKNDKPVLAAQDIAEALVLLTRLPVKMGAPRGIAAAWAWPVAGVAVAVLGIVAAKVALWLGLGPSLAALVSIVAMIVTTGAMHEDGLADCADGFWGGHDPERRLTIMKDSTVGTYGVLALLLAITIQWQALSVLFNAGHIAAPLIAAAVLSRAPMAVLMHHMPPARPAGLSGGYGRPSQDTAYVGVLLAVLIALLVSGFAAIAAILVVSATVATVVFVAYRKIGGQTGDVLGATQKLAEISVYLCLAALWR